MPPTITNLQHIHASTATSAPISTPPITHTHTTQGGTAAAHQGFALSTPFSNTIVRNIMDYQPAALLHLPFHLDMRRPSPIANPFWVPDPTTNLAPPTDHSITDAAYSTAMYAVITFQTTTFTEIADRYGLPHSSIQPPYKDIPWNLYASNFYTHPPTTPPLLPLPRRTIPHQTTLTRFRAPLSLHPPLHSRMDRPRHPPPSAIDHTPPKLSPPTTRPTNPPTPTYLPAPSLTSTPTATPIPETTPTRPCTLPHQHPPSPAPLLTTPPPPPPLTTPTFSTITPSPTAPNLPAYSLHTPATTLQNTYTSRSAPDQQTRPADQTSSKPPDQQTANNSAPTNRFTPMNHPIHDGTEDSTTRKHPHTWPRVLCIPDSEWEPRF